MADTILLQDTFTGAFGLPPDGRSPETGVWADSGGAYIDGSGELVVDDGGYVTGTPQSVSSGRVYQLTAVAIGPGCGVGLSGQPGDDGIGFIDVGLDAGDSFVSVYTYGIGDDAEYHTNTAATFPATVVITVGDDGMTVKVNGSVIATNLAYTARYIGGASDLVSISVWNTISGGSSAVFDEISLIDMDGYTAPPVVVVPDSGPPAGFDWTWESEQEIAKSLAAAAGHQAWSVTETFSGPQESGIFPNPYYELLPDRAVSDQVGVIDATWSARLEYPT